jgi:electron transfer flavoprotein beta subunit
MGADRAIRVEIAQPLDSWSVAQILAAIVQREHPQLVLMGKQAIDSDAGEAGQMLAGLLDWPQATYASRIQVKPDALEVARETDLGLETVAIRLPAVVTVDLRLNEPRYASLPAMLKAKKRPIEILSVAELGLSLVPRIHIVRLNQSSIERKCVRVRDVAELVEKLRYEAKAL